MKWEEKRKGWTRRTRLLPALASTATTIGCTNVVFCKRRRLYGLVTDRSRSNIVYLFVAFRICERMQQPLPTLTYTSVRYLSPSLSIYFVPFHQAYIAELVAAKGMAASASQPRKPLSPFCKWLLFLNFVVVFVVLPLFVAWAENEYRSAKPTGKYTIAPTRSMHVWRH